MQLIHETAFLHPKSLVDDGAIVGAQSRVWAFAHLLPGAAIGEQCNIGDHAYIEGKVRLGDRVTVKNGVCLWDCITVEDDVFIGPCAVFTNDLAPRSRVYFEEYSSTLLRRGCTIGANATILPGVTIGQYALIGAGSVVTRDVPDFAMVTGNPARLRAWVCRCAHKLINQAEHSKCEACGKEYRIAESGVLVEM